MRKYIYILLSLIATFAWGCKSYDLDVLEAGSESETSNCVEVLEDGRLLISGSISGTTFGDVSVSSRADSDSSDIDWTSIENNVVSGWCLIFGLEPTSEGEDAIDTYTDGSPMIQKIPLSINSNGLFFVTLTPYSGKAFLRIVVNLTDREELTLSDSSVMCWADYYEVYDDLDVYDVDGETLRAPTSDELKSYPVATFGEYQDQSVGLDGIYDIAYSTTAEQVANEDYNTTKPDPLSPSVAFPMSSIGFVIEDGIDEDTASDLFGSTIYLIRTCSKVDVTVSTTEFLLKEVYLIDCAQEARIRSTVLSSTGTDGNETTPDFDVPVDLGGTISYLALEEEVSNDSELNGTDDDNTTSPIYIYPNSGGDYDSNDGAVDRSVNPQYVIIKGRAGRSYVDAYHSEAYEQDGVSYDAVDIEAHYTYGYDTDGYYKIALKAQYPLTYKYDDDNNIIQGEDGVFQVETWSDLTYDVLRNTHFNIDLINVDKPGYKTYEDAANPNNPASNISYNITIMGSDGRNEILVSNGTYYVELDASRIYAKGYSEFSGSVQFSITPNDADVNYQHPAIYVMADYGVDVTGCSYTTNGKTTTAEKVELDETYADDQDSHVNDYWFKVDSSSYATAVTIDYEATASGRLRLRIGDILKFIPVRFEKTAMSLSGGVLSFVAEPDTNFAYDSIEAIDSDTTDEDMSKILNNSGEITEYVIEESSEEVVESERYLRAKIYNNDGSAMLYVVQKDTDGNSVKINTVVDVSGGELSDDGYDEGRDTISDAVIEVLLEDNNDSASIETEYYNQLITADGDGDNQDNIFTYIEKGVIDAIAADELDDDYTYSLDLSGLVSLETKTNSSDVFFRLQGGLFTGLTHLASLVLPSTISKINSNPFYGCTNLMSVTIGSESAPVDLTDGIDSGAFYGMTVGCVITIYSSIDLSSESKYLGKVDGYTSYTCEMGGTDGSVYIYTVTVKSTISSTAGETLVTDVNNLLYPTT